MTDLPAFTKRHAGLAAPFLESQTAMSPMMDEQVKIALLADQQ